MRVLVVGSGAREHALCARIAEDAREIYCAPGNGGTSRVARNLPVAATDVGAMVSAARSHAIDLVVVGPEAPLAAGLADALRAAGIRVFGPGRDAAALETSKAFAKRFMAEHAIPTASYAVFDDAARAIEHVRELARPMVVKADGLAAGKGVVVASTVEQSVAAIEAMMVAREHGAAGARVVVEERLEGPEVSYHAVCDGERYVALAAAQDHKRLLDGDLGPNTGGMGAYSPPPMVGERVERAIRERVVEPTLAGMAARGTPFRGALFVGAMIVDGEPRVLEYNVRFGDPETEVLMARWEGSALELLDAAARGDLRGVIPRWGAPASLAVVMASEGYPGRSPVGRPIEGIDDAEGVPGVRVYHAGTVIEGDRLVTSGGRVLAVTATGRDVDEAAARAYEGVSRIRFAGAQHRADIGWQARSRSR